MLVLKNISVLLFGLFAQQIFGMAVGEGDSLAKREPCDHGDSAVDFAQVEDDGEEFDDGEWDDGEDGGFLAKRDGDITAEPVVEAATLETSRFPGGGPRPPFPVPTPATPLQVTPREIRGIACLRRCLRRRCPNRPRRVRLVCLRRQIRCIRRCNSQFFP
jgi:hypothetical protein